ncbi:MAG: NAD(+)/NADH kinase [Gemmatimonadota bacterium]
MRIGVVASTAYAGIGEVLGRLRDKAGDLGFELAFDAETAARLEGPTSGLGGRWDELDLLLTLGGDGTLLRGARAAGPRGIPVVGCNIGRLGFLTSAPLSELERALERLAAGEYREEERATLSVGVVRADGTTEGEESPPADGAARTGGAACFYALNDAVVHKSGFARLITLRVWVDDEEVGQYSADGIVLATATGSTAYSLSAGGPVLVPDMDAVVATPISPHTLAVRPVVVPADSVLTVEVRPRSQETILTLDGQGGVDLGVGDRVEARRSPHPVRLVQFPGQSFFSVLRRKLRWGDVRPADR